MPIPLSPSAVIFPLFFTRPLALVISGLPEGLFNSAYIPIPSFPATVIFPLFSISINLSAAVKVPSVIFLSVPYLSKCSPDAYPNIPIPLSAPVILIFALVSFRILLPFIP